MKLALDSESDGYDYVAPIERLVWLVEHDGTVHTAVLWLPPDLPKGVLEDGRAWVSASLEFC